MLAKHLFSHNWDTRIIHWNIKYKLIDVFNIAYRHSIVLNSQINFSKFNSSKIQSKCQCNLFVNFTKCNSRFPTWTWGRLFAKMSQFSKHPHSQLQRILKKHIINNFLTIYNTTFYLSSNCVLQENVNIILRSGEKWIVGTAGTY